MSIISHKPNGSCPRFPPPCSLLLRAAGGAHLGHPFGLWDKGGLKVFVILIFLLIGCGSLQSISLDDGTPNTNESAGNGRTYLFATDFVSSGQLLTADTTTAASLENTGVTGFGSSAVVRFFDGLVYVLHTGFSNSSSDNVQILDPGQDYRTLFQWSTGNGTNPLDLVVIGNKAYMTLYNPEQDGDQKDEAGNPADLVIMNLQTGTFEKRISFYNDLNEDSSKTARADQMVRVENKLYICVQDLDGPNFVHNAPGKIAVIDLATDTLEQVLVLKGRNPIDIAYSPEVDKLFVAHLAPFNNNFPKTNLYALDPYGGVEVISRDDPTHSVLIHDDALGGYVDRLVVGNESLVGVVSQLSATGIFSSRLLKMPLENEAPAGFSVFLDSSADIREIAVDFLDRLWVARRTIVSGEGRASEPRLDILDLGTGLQISSPFFPVAPITSIAFDEP